MKVVIRHFDSSWDRNRENFARTNRFGWTLIELMVVVTLISIIALATTFNFAGPVKSARYSNACQQIQELDHRIRRDCLKSNRAAELKIDLEQMQLTANGPEHSKTYLLPEEVTIQTVIDANGNVTQHKTTSIRFDGYGSSNTYGVAIAMNEKTRWFVFLGRTGECIEMENEQEAKDFFKSIQSIGVNAD